MNPFLIQLPELEKASNEEPSVTVWLYENGEELVYMLKTTKADMNVWESRCVYYGIAWR